MIAVYRYWSFQNLKESAQWKMTLPFLKICGSYFKLHPTTKKNTPGHLVLHLYMVSRFFKVSWYTNQLIQHETMHEWMYTAQHRRRRILRGLRFQDLWRSNIVLFGTNKYRYVQILGIRMGSLLKAIMLFITSNDTCIGCKTKDLFNWLINISKLAYNFVKRIGLCSLDYNLYAKLDMLHCN